MAARVILTEAMFSPASEYAILCLKSKFNGHSIFYISFPTFQIFFRLSCICTESIWFTQLYLLPFTPLLC